METSNIEINIKEKFQNRTFSPSNSAWERLAVQLDEKATQKRRGWFFYTTIAASVLVLLSIGLGFFSSEKNQFQPIDEVVMLPVDTISVDTKQNDIFKNTEINEAVVALEKTKSVKTIVPKKAIKHSFKNEVISNPISSKSEISMTVAKATIKLPQVTSGVIASNNLKKSVIKIDADDLLFAVTHTQQEIETYYAKNNIDRKKLLQAIENQLQEANVNVSANSILAEAEQNINEDTFKNNFLQMIKKKVSDVATAVAARNN